jgi:hypothetical protein
MHASGPENRCLAVTSALTFDNYKVAIGPADGPWPYLVFYPVVMGALQRHDRLVGANPTRLILAPAGSTRSGPGGNEWAEALLETASKEVGALCGPQRE